jgi:hypothetical protein
MHNTLNTAAVPNVFMQIRIYHLEKLLPLILDKVSFFIDKINIRWVLG